MSAPNFKDGFYLMAGTIAVAWYADAVKAHAERDARAKFGTAHSYRVLPAAEVNKRGQQ
jgi:hypothetical protein